MKYEYKFIKFDFATGNRVHEESLNALGKEGWEAINIWSDERDGNRFQRACLKRVIPGSEQAEPTYTLVIKRGLFGRGTTVKKGRL